MSKKVEVRTCPVCKKHNIDGKIGAQCAEHVTAGLTPDMRKRLLGKISVNVPDGWIKLSELARYIKDHHDICGDSEYKKGFGGDTPLGERKYLDNGGGFIPVIYHGNDRYVPAVYKSIAGLKAIHAGKPLSMLGTKVGEIDIENARKIVRNMLTEIIAEMGMGDK